MRVAEAAGEILLLIPNLSVLGFLELSLGRPAEADAYLSRAVELERAMGVREPAYFRIVPDEVERWWRSGGSTRPRRSSSPSRRAGTNLDRAWAIATGARCRALVLAARVISPVHRPRPTRPLREHDRLPLPFELGRTLLVRGSGGAPGEEEAGGSGHADEGLGDLRGLGPRCGRTRHARSWRGSADGLPRRWTLTPTEDKVAALVASGSTNREVAEALFVSVHTVEANLKRIYRKLGVRSRTELASSFPPDASGS
jgi:DNA-binding CsgD family transcriptional regulator